MATKTKSPPNTRKIAPKQPGLPGVAVRRGSPHGKAKAGNSNTVRRQVMLNPYEIHIVDALRTRLSPHARLSESACLRALVLAGIKTLSKVST